MNAISQIFLLIGLLTPLSYAYQCHYHERSMQPNSALPAPAPVVEIDELAIALAHECGDGGAEVAQLYRRIGLDCTM